MTQKSLIDRINKELERVMDPELFIPITDLGLIYGIHENNGTAYIKMTLSSIGCPLFHLIESDITSKIKKIPGINTVKVELTFEPPWTKEKMTEKAKATLGIF